MAVRRDFPLIVGPGFKVSLNRPLPHVLKLAQPYRRPQIDEMILWCTTEPSLEGFFQCRKTVLAADLETLCSELGVGCHISPNARYNVIFRFSHFTTLQTFSVRNPVVIRCA